MSSLIKSITELAGPAVISAVAGKLGESESGVAKAIGALIPTILSGMVEKVGSEEGLGSLFGTLSAPETGGFLDDLGGLVGGGNLAQGDPRDVAGGLIGSMFGDKVGSILSAVASLAGFSEKGSAGGLLGLAGPLVMGFLGKKIATEGLSAFGLKDLLLGEKDEVYGGVPPAIAGLIGVTPAAAAPVAATAAATTATATAAPVAAGSVGWLKWVIPLIAIGALGWWLLRAGKVAPVSKDDHVIAAHNDADITASTEVDDYDDSHAELAKTVDNTANGALEAVDDTAAEHVADPVVELVEEVVVEVIPDDAEETADALTEAVDDVDLSSVVPGLDLTEFSDGVEGKLVRFIESDTEPCTVAGCWFTMDRLTFESGSSRVDIDRSTDQLNKIKAIMNAYPTLNLKFGGYTDNTGDVASNLALSQHRVESVVTTLVGMGVDGGRMSAEGYGVEFPVASNDTPEGRAQNRRIDVRVKQR